MTSILNILNHRNILIFIFISSLVATLTALISEHVFGFKPCILCIYERIPYILTIISSIIGLVIPKIKRLMLILCLLVFIFSTILSLYHIGVEYNIFEGTSSCNISAPIPNHNLTMEELRTEILQNQRPACNQVSFTFLGISMTGWNAILSIILVYISYYALRKFKYE